MSDYNTVFNTRFLSLLKKPGGIDKAAFAIGDYVATKVREESFLDQILPPETVMPTELQGNVNSETLKALCEIEPEETAALELLLDGQPTGKYFRGRKFEVPFWVNSTRRFEKSTYELLSYRMSLREVIERNAVNQLVRIQDTQWLTQCQAAVDASGKLVTSTATIPNRTDITALINLLDGDELECDTLLMRKDTWNRLNEHASAQLDVGAWDTFKNGYVERTLLGRKVIVSLKNVVDPGEVWAFCSPRFIGKHYIIEDTNAELKEEFKFVQFEVRKFFGFNIGNIYSVAKLELATS